MAKTWNCTELPTRHRLRPNAEQLASGLPQFPTRGGCYVVAEAEVAFPEHLLSA